MEYLEENLDEWLGEHLKVWGSVGCVGVASVCVAMWTAWSCNALYYSRKTYTRTFSHF